MGRIKLILLLSLLQQFILSIDCISQPKDTIYIIDYFVSMGAPWKSDHFVNNGTTVIVNKTDSFFLKATKNDMRLRIQNLHPQKGIVYGSSNFRIQTLRIIKNAEASISLRIQSQKKMGKDIVVFDTTLSINNYSEKPLIYINLLRVEYACITHKRTVQMTVSNKDFVWKNNYRKPKIINSINNSVKYDYVLTE